MSLPQDYGFVPGRNREVALKLLELAEELGFEPGVVGARSKNPDGTPGGGYQVPDKVLKAYQKHLKQEAKAIGGDDDAAAATEAAKAAADAKDVQARAASEKEAEDAKTDADDKQESEPPTDVTAQPAPDGTVITPENAGVVVDADGTEHVGELPNPDDAAPTEDAEQELPEPPRAGAGSGFDVWVTYAKNPARPTAAEVPWDPEDEDNLGRNEIIAKYGKPVQE